MALEVGTNKLPPQSAMFRCIPDLLELRPSWHSHRLCLLLHSSGYP